VTAPWTTHARFRVVESHAVPVQRRQRRGLRGAGADRRSASATTAPDAGAARSPAEPGAAGPDRRYSLAVSGARGTLELLDLAGRRVALRDLTGESAGPHQVRMLSARRCGRALYMLRLTHAGSVRRMKVAVIQ
jgi:hypothetical protein